MKRQIHIEITGKEKIVIDANSDESVSFVFDNPPTSKRLRCEGKVPNYRIDGLRWSLKDGHYHLGWGEGELDIGDKIFIEIKEDIEEPSQLEIEERYIPPEIDCSFCDKKKSEVEVLIERNIMAIICNECVKSCQEIIDNEKAKI